jgi:hypothetical protein
LGTLDFYTVHYYDWGGTALSPFHHPYSTWQLTKPLVVAEFYLNNAFGVAYGDMFEVLYTTGYAGALTWQWANGGTQVRRTKSTMLELVSKYPGDVVVSVERVAGEFPAGFELLQNYPNPFNPSTTIEFSVPREEHVRLEIFDMLGRHMETLVNGDFEPGRYSVAWNALEYASGMYLYRIQAGGFVATRRLVLMK